MRDGALKAQLAMNGQTDALKKLVAVEQREMLNASQSGMAGVQRALIDYQNKIRDVAKSTQDMTTKMFSGLEDAMVGWVQTGKLNFKSLVDSIIADMARIVIEQSIMGPLISMLGSGLGIFGGAAGGGGGGFGGMKAEGGSVQAGKSYIVGEKGPEWFQPAVGGTIVPRSNSLGSGGGITFAPIINVDSRADRAQVHADVVNAVRQGQRDLLATLIRYNPSLRV
jgi:phage-related minor tail protein